MPEKSFSQRERSLVIQNQMIIPTYKQQYIDLWVEIV